MFQLQVTSKQHRYQQKQETYYLMKLVTGKYVKLTEIKMQRIFYIRKS